MKDILNLVIIKDIYIGNWHIIWNLIKPHQLFLIKIQRSTIYFSYVRWGTYCILLKTINHN
jgi:hypothetical protein